MAATTEHLASLLPPLAEGVAGRREVASDEAVSEVVQVITSPPALHLFEVTRPNQSDARKKVDRKGPNRRPRSLALDRAAEPSAGRSLEGTGDVPRRPRDLLAETIELLHRRVVALRHVAEMFLCDVRHVL